MGGLMRECPISDFDGNQEMAPLRRFGALQSINRCAPIAEVIEAFLAARIPKKSAARGYRKHLLDAFGMMGLESLEGIRPGHLAGFVADLLADGRGKATHAHAAVSLRSFMEWAAALEGHDLRMETVRFVVPVPKVKVITPHVSMNPGEVDAFILAARSMGPREHAMAVVALGSGVRVAEMVALDVRDIWADPYGGTVVHVRQGKGDKDRLIPVLPTVKRVVEHYLESSGRARTSMGPLFQAEDHALSCRDSWRITTKSASRIVKAIAELAGIPKRVTPHALRHTFAFVSFEHCKNPVAIQKLLGHASLNTTMRYLAHLEDLDLRMAISPKLAGGRTARKVA